MHISRTTDSLPVARQSLHVTSSKQLQKVLVERERRAVIMERCRGERILASREVGGTNVALLNEVESWVEQSFCCAGPLGGIESQE